MKFLFIYARPFLNLTQSEHQVFWVQKIKEVTGKINLVIVNDCVDSSQEGVLFDLLKTHFLNEYQDKITVKNPESKPEAYPSSLQQRFDLAPSRDKKDYYCLDYLDLNKDLSFLLKQAVNPKKIQWSLLKKRKPFSYPLGERSSCSQKENGEMNFNLKGAMYYSPDQSWWERYKKMIILGLGLFSVGLLAGLSSLFLKSAAMWIGVGGKLAGFLGMSALGANAFASVLGVMVAIAGLLLSLLIYAFFVSSKKGMDYYEKIRKDKDFRSLSIYMPKNSKSSLPASQMNSPINLEKMNPRQGEGSLELELSGTPLGLTVATEEKRVAPV